MKNACKMRALCKDTLSVIYCIMREHTAAVTFTGYRYGVKQVRSGSTRGEFGMRLVCVCEAFWVQLGFVWGAMCCLLSHTA